MKASAGCAQVRPLEAAGREAWRGLWGAYARFYEKPEAPEAITPALWPRLFDPAAFVRCLHRRDTSVLNPVRDLQDLFAAPEARGEGRRGSIGSRMTRVHWLTHETSLTARRLYHQVAERSGFLQRRKTR